MRHSAMTVLAVGLTLGFAAVCSAGAPEDVERGERIRKFKVDKYTVRVYRTQQKHIYMAKVSRFFFSDTLTLRTLATGTYKFDKETAGFALRPDGRTLSHERIRYKPVLEDAPGFGYYCVIRYPPSEWKRLPEHLRTGADNYYLYASIESTPLFIQTQPTRSE